MGLGCGDHRRRRVCQPPPLPLPLPLSQQALKTFGSEVGIAFSGAEDVALVEYAHLTGRPYRVFRCALCCVCLHVALFVQRRRRLAALFVARR